MINLLSPSEQENVNKADLIDLEINVLQTLNFNFICPGPIQSLERYLMVLQYDKKTSVVYSMAYQICKFSQNDSMFLVYRPSQLAAAALIICINIYQRDEMRSAQDESEFF
jgi:hypothetical protein